MATNNPYMPNVSNWAEQYNKRALNPWETTDMRTGLPLRPGQTSGGYGSSYGRGGGGGDAGTQAINYAQSFTNNMQLPNRDYLGGASWGQPPALSLTPIDYLKQMQGLLPALTQLDYGNYGAGGGGASAANPMGYLGGGAGASGGGGLSNVQRLAPGTISTMELRSPQSPNARWGDIQAAIKEGKVPNGYRGVTLDAPGGAGGNLMYSSPQEITLDQARGMNGGLAQGQIPKGVGGLGQYAGQYGADALETLLKRTPQQGRSGGYAGTGAPQATMPQGNTVGGGLSAANPMNYLPGGQAPGYGPASAPPQTAGQGMNVTGGISQQSIGAPQIGAPGGISGMSSTMASGYGQGLPQFAAPLQNQLTGQYLQGNAGLQNAIQEAQAQSGLGWAGLGGLLNRLGQNYQTGQQGNLLSLLGGMI